MGAWEDIVNFLIKSTDYEKWKLEIADAILNGKRTTDWQRQNAYLFITGKWPEKAKRGTPPGKRTESRNRKMFLRYATAIEGGKTSSEAITELREAFSSLSDDGIFSALRQGKSSLWQKWDNTLHELNMKKNLCSHGDFFKTRFDIRDIEDQISKIEFLKADLEKLGLGPKNRGWLPLQCKKNRSK
jgi:hypothetical protein